MIIEENMSENTAETLERALSIAMSRAPSHDTPDGGKLVIIPKGYQVENVSPLEKPLPRIVQSVTFHDRDSFVSYVNRYKSSATRLFAAPGFLDSGGAVVTAIIDYHEADTPAYGVHVATYRPRYSEQWKTWERAASAPMRQAEFAEFIEENRADVSAPEAAVLLDIIRTFKASRKIEFDSVVYQPNGDVKLAYEDKTQQGTSVLPEKMQLGIPVYFRGTRYAVPVFIRYKVGSGVVQFQLKLDRPDVIEDEAFSELTSDISDKTGIEVYLGRRG